MLTHPRLLWTHLSEINLILFWFIYLFISSHHFSFSYEFSDVEFIESNNHKFDVLIFTQRWPITSCLEWMEEKQNNVCLLPSQKGIWTIHGIWPTRFGSIGPAFCNKSAEFDVNTLQPFREQLQQYWLNIEKGMPLIRHLAPVLRWATLARQRVYPSLPLSVLVAHSSFIKSFPLWNSLLTCRHTNRISVEAWMAQARHLCPRSTRIEYRK